MLYDLSQVRKDPVLEAITKGTKFLLEDNGNNFRRSKPGQRTTNDDSKGDDIEFLRSPPSEIEREDQSIFMREDESFLVRDDLDMRLGGVTRHGNNQNASQRGKRVAPGARNKNLVESGNQRTSKKEVKARGDEKNWQSPGERDNRQKEFINSTSERLDNNEDYGEHEEEISRFKIRVPGEYDPKDNRPGQKTEAEYQRLKNSGVDVDNRPEHKVEAEYQRENDKNVQHLKVDNRPPQKRESVYVRSPRSNSINDPIVIFEEKEEVMYKEGKSVVETVLVEKVITDQAEKELYWARQKLKNKSKEKQKPKESEGTFFTKFRKIK